MALATVRAPSLPWPASCSDGLMRCDFDRGTIVLRDLPEDLASGLPGVTWDDRVGAHRAAACEWPALRAMLAVHGLDGSLPGHLAPLEGDLRMPDLRGYQRAALDTWRSCGQRGVVVLPTGAGKTRVALAAIATLRLPTLVLVPTRVLMAQWVEALMALGGGPVGRLGDTHRTVEPLTVATYESAWRHSAGIGDRFGLIVVDEAHHVGGAMRAEPLEMSLAPFRLGLTALPPGARVGSRIDELVGPVVFALRVSDLAGSLAPIRLVGIGLDLSPEERARWMGDMSRYRAERSRHALESFGRPWRMITALLAQSHEGRCALAARSRAASLASFTTAKALVLAAILGAHREDRTIVFTRDNASAHAISRAHLIPAVTCDMRPRERREVLAAFARGDVRALVSARVLDEGVDVPEARVAVIVGAGRSERQHVQRVGRILRPAPGKRAIVYDIFNLEAGEAMRASGRRAAVAS